MLIRLFHYRSLDYRYLPERSLYICLVPWFLWWDPGKPFDCLAQPASETLRSYSAVTNGETDLGWLRPTPSVQHRDSSLEHMPSLSVKKAYLLVLELQSKGQASGVVHI